MKNTINEIVAKRDLSIENLVAILSTDDHDTVQYLFAQAHETAIRVYGNKIFIRGLIEISNHCKNDCLYCGIRRSQTKLKRYRLTQDEILASCQQGYDLGIRTFVLQGGEDAWFTDDRLCDIVSSIHQQHPTCAITLSVGERSRESYQRLYNAGAERYLLRHETADAAHYAKIHPAEMSFDNRMQCLRNLKEIGYQVGCGFMVGSPYQTIETLYQDLQFIRHFQPQMVGIGPFIPTQNTPFADRPAGTVDTTLRLLALIRILHPQVLLPATTALGTLHPQGRELGILAGANVIMPNITPQRYREQYNIYDNKLSTGSEAAETIATTRCQISKLGADIPTNRGDYKENN